MFGFSFGELILISLVALVAVGPKKLPGMLKTMGQYARKLRQMTIDVRQQTGIDEMLRAEGIQISELRSLLRGAHNTYQPPPAARSPEPEASAEPAPSPAFSGYEDPYAHVEPDVTREYPPEGADAGGALPDDLIAPPPTHASDEPSTAEPAAAEPAATEPAAAEPAAAEPATTEPATAAAVDESWETTPSIANQAAHPETSDTEPKRSASRTTDV